MLLLQRWLRNADAPQVILDLGCGKGSFDFRGCCSPETIVVGTDVDYPVLRGAGSLLAVCSDGSTLPFRRNCFDLIICHHSLEHFQDSRAVVSEIARILKPSGRLFISVPDGRSFSDRLYRLLLTGGGHFQQFTFESLVLLVEAETGLRLTAWKPLYSSFNYLDKRTFQPAPLGMHPGPLPRRMRWVGLLPEAVITGIRAFLNIATRQIDHYAGSRLSRYGWAFAFEVSAQRDPLEEPASRNVCMKCGCGALRDEIEPIGRGVLYRCENCGGVNFLFADGPRERA
jgi:SAM-dependent methyltransferase